jgi:hypothetical protein
MIDSSTLKALTSTVLTFAVIIFVGALTSAIGQDTEPRAAAPTANPYETVESDATPAAHNQPDRVQASAAAAHNTP